MTTNLRKFLDKIKQEFTDLDGPISQGIQDAMDVLVHEGRPEDEIGGRDIRNTYYRLSRLRDCFKEIEQED